MALFRYVSSLFGVSVLSKVEKHTVSSYRDVYGWIYKRMFFHMYYMDEPLEVESEAYEMDMSAQGQL